MLKKCQKFNIFLVYVKKHKYLLFLDFDGVLNTNHNNNNNNREIDHYVIINDLLLNNSDLKKVRNLLVKTKFYSVKKEDEGLIEIHKKEVGKILQIDNEIKKYAKERKL